MGITLISIILGIVSLPIFFFFSLEVAGWIIWGFYLIFSIILFLQSFIEYKTWLKGKAKSATDIMGIYSVPYYTISMVIILIIFLFLNISKLHLLWIYPCVALFFENTLGKRGGQIHRPDIFKDPWDEEKKVKDNV